MKQSFFRNGLIVLTALFSSTGTAQEAHKFLLKGDQFYDQEKYKASEEQYRSAVKKAPADPSATYNLGNALYQQGKWEDAAKQFETASEGFKSPDKKAGALHNLGNARLQQQQYEAAVNAYKQSLRYQPDAPDTKKNLQIAAKKLKKQQQEQESRQQQDKQQQQQSNQPQEDGQDPPKEQKPENDRQPGQGKQTPEQKSREEARRLLETAVESEDQRNARKYRTARQKPSGQTKKDW